MRASSSGGEDFLGQALGAFWAEQGFQVDAQPLPVAPQCHQGRSAAFAVGDGAADMGGPNGGAVFAHAGGGQSAIQLQHGCAGAQAPGQKFGLAFGHRALNTRRHVYVAAGKVIVFQLGRDKVGA
jgi:hypothetical protein